MFVKSTPHSRSVSQLVALQCTNRGCHGHVPSLCADYLIDKGIGLAYSKPHYFKLTSLDAFHSLNADLSVD